MFLALLKSRSFFFSATKFHHTETLSCRVYACHSPNLGTARQLNDVLNKRKLKAPLDMRLVVDSNYLNRTYLVARTQLIDKLIKKCAAGAELEARTQQALGDGEEESKAQKDEEGKQSGKAGGEVAKVSAASSGSAKSTQVKGPTETATSTSEVQGEPSAMEVDSKTSEVSSLESWAVSSRTYC